MKVKKAEMLCIFSSAPNSSVQQVPQRLFQNHRTPILLQPLFQRISQPPSQDQQNAKPCRPLTV